ncbi:Uracil phosphoribosyltransferase [Phytophthora cinnamomi]|uniref:Uracil phosphoribosyltransferase n=1 Tax=Phytophthora cinnamomi TaxID=4785 RepID=UPI003559A315|nr:Uracil phosphoribosyltransferase [Phytophthora cinnamomi]
MQQQPLGEFMALHAAANGIVGSSVFRLQDEQGDSAVPLASPCGEDDEQQQEAKTEENEDNNAPHKKPRRRVRYLHDAERHSIIKRIENGEKQAALAREFGVTRAAICHIKKNREEIVTRYDMLVKQAQEIDRAENFSEPPGEDLMVREIRSSPVLLLMTTLRDRETDPPSFRRAAGRLIMLLLEEALATISAQTIEMTTSTGHPASGLQRTEEFCGVTVGAEGFPFQVLFHQMEPDAPRGSIHVGLETHQEGPSEWRLEHMDLPRDIAQYSVLLFSSTVNTGGGECKAIEALCSLGVEESRITLVAILCSTDSLVAICNRFPGVRIITSAIDSKVDPETQAIIPGMGDFVSRYNGE